LAVKADAAFSITDPGNADGVITVGSTHRFWPHTYRVSHADKIKKEGIPPSFTDTSVPNLSSTVA
jgi:hypothetical protein